MISAFYGIFCFYSTPFHSLAVVPQRTSLLPNHVDSRLITIFKCCMIFVMLIQNTFHWLQCISGSVFLQLQNSSVEHGLVKLAEFVVQFAIHILVFKYFEPKTVRLL